MYRRSGAASCQWRVRLLWHVAERGIEKYIKPAKLTSTVKQEPEFLKGDMLTANICGVFSTSTKQALRRQVTIYLLRAPEIIIIGPGRSISRAEVKAACRAATAVLAKSSHGKALA